MSVDGRKRSELLDGLGNTAGEFFDWTVRCCLPMPVMLFVHLSRTGPISFISIWYSKAIDPREIPEENLK